MKVVVQMLEGEGDNLTMPPNPFASTGPTRISMPARKASKSRVKSHSKIRISIFKLEV